MRGVLRFADSIPRSGVEVPNSARFTSGTFAAGSKLHPLRVPSIDPRAPRTSLRCDAEESFIRLNLMSTVLSQKEEELSSWNEPEPDGVLRGK